MPFHYGLGLDEDQSFAPTGEDMAQAEPEQPIGLFEPGPGSGALQNLELMTKSKVFEHGLRTGANCAKQRTQETAKQLKHRPMSLLPPEIKPLLRSSFRYPQVRFSCAIL